jgi:hypothetical protein
MNECANYDFQTAFDRVHARITDLAIAQGKIADRLGVLVGNGQPGIISKLENRVDLLESKNDQERGVYWAMRAFWVAIAAVVGSLAHWLWHGK